MNNSPIQKGPSVALSCTVTIGGPRDAKRIVDLVADAQLSNPRCESMNIMDMGGYEDYGPDLMELGKDPVPLEKLLEVIENWDVFRMRGDDLVELQNFLGGLLVVFGNVVPK